MSSPVIPVARPSDRGVLPVDQQRAVVPLRLGPCGARLPERPQVREQSGVVQLRRVDVVRAGGVVPQGVGQRFVSVLVGTVPLGGVDDDPRGGQPGAWRQRRSDSGSGALRTPGQSCLPATFVPRPGRPILLALWHFFRLLIARNVRRTLEHVKRHVEAAVGVLAHTSRVTSRGSAVEGHARLLRPSHRRLEGPALSRGYVRRR